MTEEYMVMQDLSETEKHVRELVEYIIEDKDVEIIDSYTETFMLICTEVEKLSRQSESDRLACVILEVKEMYPYNIFPKAGKSTDCISAEMARVTCDNIERRLSEKP